MPYGCVPRVRGRERQRMLGEVVRFFQAAGQSIRCSQGETTEGLKAYHVRRSALLHRLRQERQGVGHASAQGVRLTQSCRQRGKIDREICLVTDTHGPFEEGERPGEVALAEGQQTDPP